ncbi:MAG: alpha/beta fold hydrolase [Gammaproteobacteria bacterium]|nr:alpha/beta fold hydrolase [Gammaproteobacteria bacterium]
MIRTRGPRACPPLIWIHGWLGDGGGARALRGLGRNVISLTLPGYAAGGHSGEMGVEVAIKAVGEALKQQPDAVLVGHSMGGLIAVRGGLESHQRPRGLVLLAPVPPSGVFLEARARDLFAGAAGDSRARQAMRFSSGRWWTISRRSGCRHAGWKAS